MKMKEILKQVSAALTAVLFVLALAPVPARAAVTGFVHIEDTVQGGYVYDLRGGGIEAENFGYDIPEGGLTALIFFKNGCWNCQNLFKTITNCPLMDDPRVNVVAVSFQGQDETQSFAEKYINERFPKVYYDVTGAQAWKYVDLVLNEPGFKTAFVLLVGRENGKPYILWYGKSVSSGQTVQEAADKLLSTGLRMTKTGESVRDGRVCLLVRLDAAGPVSGSLWAVGYSGGRAADVQSVPLTLSAGETAMEEFTVRGETAKLFCLEEGTLRPLAPALTAGG